MSVLPTPFLDISSIVLFANGDGTWTAVQLLDTSLNISAFGEEFSFLDQTLQETPQSPMIW